MTAIEKLFTCNSEITLPAAKDEYKALLAALESARKVIANAWIDGAHEDAREWLINNPEVNP
jgi:hypothetical protein